MSERASKAPRLFLGSIRYDLENLLGCNAIAFGSDDYFSYIAGALKDFFDRTYYPSKGKLAGKPYAAFATGGQEGRSALTVLDRLSSFFKLKKAVDGVSIAGVPSSEDLVRCREAGIDIGDRGSQNDCI
jgi:multimeric flavodoxin WrbA